MNRTAADQNFGKPEQRLTRESGICSPLIKGQPIAATPVSRCSGRPPLRTAAVLLALLLSGCAGVKPWQRDVLSTPGMQTDPNPLISACDDHIYFSREASKGGRGFGGGGCGCN